MSGLTEVHTRARTTGLSGTKRAPALGLDLPLSHHGVLLALEGNCLHPPPPRCYANRQQGSEDAASFERTLNALTGKINRAAARNDSQKQLARRARVMWTLYAGFAYILIAVVLTFVTGWQNWGPIEGSVVAGGPLLYVPPPGLFTRLTVYLQHLRLALRAHELL